MTWLMEILKIYRKEQRKVLCDKAFNIAKNPEYDGHQCGITSVFLKFFDRMFSGCNIIQNKRPLDSTTQELVEELHKVIIRNLQKEKYIHFL